MPYSVKSFREVYHEKPSQFWFLALVKAPFYAGDESTKDIRSAFIFSEAILELVK